MQCHAALGSGSWTPVGVWCSAVAQRLDGLNLCRLSTAFVSQAGALSPWLLPCSFHTSFLKSRVQTLLLSKQFVQWNEILTRLETAKEAKPAAE